MSFTFLRNRPDIQKAKTTFISAFEDVITTKNSLLSAQLNGVNDKLQELQSVVQLYHALDGGWQN
ncbi:hypothetical protein [uncultured Formosa sp.]|uniref:hypothetical protein n=1 Tax=uncultured Formosa sp. TaxID=255435 RepID=UPI0026112A5E|nr:hypothetical protein [uncultured Formosa sp.]